ncbi:MAG: L-histidine N(alpha)-methyltransferase, partial [Balneolales bacterium]
TELEIFNLYKEDIYKELSDQSIIVEPGSGNSEKIAALLEIFPNFKVYIPIEISRDHLLENNLVLAEKFPDIQIVSVASDYMNPAFNLDELVPGYKNPLVFFPGSSIGNYNRAQALHVLKQFTSLMRGKGKLLIGVDLKKDPAILEKAYNDEKGLTAAFNQNALHHIKKELDIERLNPDDFIHKAWYNSELGRVEMHLESKTEQEFKINGALVHFNKGETIHTENSYKYTVTEFESLASGAGLNLQKYWTDFSGYFSVQLYNYK